MEKAQHFAEEALRVAERLDAAARLVGAHMALGVVLLWQGKLEPALAQFRRGSEIFEPNMQFPDWPGSHPAVQSQFCLALISWMLGYPDRSLEEAPAAVKSAETLGHPVTLAQTLCYAALVHIFRREPPAAADCAERALKTCEEHHIAHHHAFAVCENGWADARRHRRKREGAGPNWPRGGRLSRDAPTYAVDVAGRCAIGERQARSGACVGRRGAEGGRKDGRSAVEAELYRLRGEALLAGAGTVSEAETAMQQSIAVARRQNAKSWELRGAMSLARLRRQQGRPQEAVALLAPILGWFEEGFDTADLKEAKTLLDNLG
jgi:tetratricopeptide (TPR) repeat protein